MSHSSRKRYDQRERDRRWANRRSLKLRSKALDSLKDPWERDDLPNQLLLDIVVEDCETSRCEHEPPIEIPRRVLEGY